MERAWNRLLCEEEAFLKAEYLLFLCRFFFFFFLSQIGWELEREWKGRAPSGQTTVRVHASLTRDSFVHREYCVQDYVKYLAKRAKGQGSQNSERANN